MLWLGIASGRCVNIYALISGVPGESTGAGHTGWTDVSSWDHSIAWASPYNPAQGTVNFTKQLDKGSPQLYELLSAGSTIPSVKVDFVEVSGGANVLFYEFTLNNVQVTTIQPSASAGSIPTENVSLKYQQIAWTYTQVNNGKPGRNITATWDTTNYAGSYNGTSVVADSDGDGIPDWWMMKYFGHVAGEAADNSMANQDADHDGLSNAQEYIAGTDPTNPDSVLKVTKINAGNGLVNLTWSSVAGKTYTIYSASQVDGPYSPMLAVPSAGDGVTSTNLAGSPYNQFYRVGVP
ncbi:MAG TPA: type VI secretion system tube protein TssD [Dongiaceae bacterium]|nr:type VI secretion system tube protein TssD [Dongiaceae bacterium]